ncbi:MAG: LacI family transcriptional regulator [Opitutaceae bacterium]|jgi:LacI family transcriptional regulator/LacI family repressor for deo operon, udp, cdd, tsx, nupC, and nupG|nr:LacI family transcriptional regulator [Opitutaceae bacterium]
MKKRVNQKEIALLAGVSPATVSMAFTNHPSIPVSTRERVLSVAHKLGYVRDPMLSALAAYRTSRRPSSFQGTIAWLFNSMGAFDWRLSTHFSDYYAGACRQAQPLGYQIETFDANEERQSSKRLMSMFAAKNIRGILLCPQPAPQMKMELPWENFSTTTFGYSLASPHLHTVSAAHYLATQEVYRRLRAGGRKRIGLAIARVSVERTNFNYLAAYLASQAPEQRADYIPPFLQYFPEIALHPEPLSNFKDWMDDNKLDAIIAEDVRILKILATLGKRVPDDIAVASPCLPKADTLMTGIVEDSVKIGGVAVDFLVAAIHRGETGIPESPQRIHIEGKWNPGHTA